LPGGRTISRCGCRSLPPKRSVPDSRYFSQKIRTLERIGPQPSYESVPTGRSEGQRDAPEDGRVTPAELVRGCAPLRRARERRAEPGPRVPLQGRGDRPPDRGRGPCEPRDSSIPSRPPPARGARRCNTPLQPRRQEAAPESYPRYSP